MEHSLRKNTKLLVYDMDIYFDPFWYKGHGEGGKQIPLPSGKEFSQASKLERKVLDFFSMSLFKYEYFAKAFIIILIGPLDVKCMVINSALPSSAARL